MRYWRPLTRQDCSITLSLGLSWIVLISLWVLLDYNTAEYTIVPCRDDVCRVQYLKGVKSICFAEFSTIPVPGVCGVDCPADFATNTGDINVTLPCDFDKATKCPLLICKKYTNIGLFFSLIGVTIIIAGATFGLIFMESLAYYTKQENQDESSIE